MGIRSTVKFYSNHGSGESVMSVYRQYDGYINGVGHELAEWLKDKKVIDGISEQTMEEGYANGMGCLAAQYVAAHKEGIGGFYLTTPDDSQKYNYEVRWDGSEFEIKVDDIFTGTPDELLNFEENQDEG